MGDKKMHARTAEGDFILPMMCEAMNTIIADNTHLTARCEAMLEALNSDVAKALEPTFDELNPPPEPRKEYRYHLGDTVYIGTQEYELLSFDEKKVVLFDTQFPLFNKELTREEFDNRLKENPLNDKLLQVVEEPPVADNAKENPDMQETEAIPDEELDALPISTVKDGEVGTYPNAEALLDDQKESLAPPPQVKISSRVAPHVLYPEISTEYRTNFQIESDDIGVGTPLERFYHNIRAIQLLNKLDAESRLATPTEQRVLADYVGWGGLSEFFKEDNPHYTELKNVLSDEEYASARESTLTAFYTPPVVIKAVYSALENMHFQTGNVLEPSCGIGNFMGLVPESMNDAKFYGVELDSISGRIAQQLYQKNSIAVQGFESTNLPDSFFDAAIGNVPFGQFKVPDKRYDKHNFLIHDYFFARTLDKVRPGGVIAFITSKGTMDKENPNVRKYIAQRADLLGAMSAIRLFEGVQHVLPMLSENKKRMVVAICAEEEISSIEWARLKKDKWVNRSISCPEYVQSIYKMMNWNKECRYKIYGRLANSERGLVLVFDLASAVMFDPLPEEYFDKHTGKMKKRIVKYYPDEIRMKLGRSYSDYEALQQRSSFESLSGYMDTSGGAVPATVSEELAASISMQEQEKKRETLFGTIIGNGGDDDVRNNE